MKKKMKSINYETNLFYLFGPHSVMFVADGLHFDRMYGPYLYRMFKMILIFAFVFYLVLFCSTV